LKGHLSGGSISVSYVISVGHYQALYYLYEDMTLEDPFFVVKDEVCKALNKTRGLYQRWGELQEEGTIVTSKEQLDWTNTELRNALRSIEWDLEDLEETI
ncbi:hypothetical protein OTU49_006753, partial [Cherax quadricarinatus]